MCCGGEPSGRDERAGGDVEVALRLWETKRMTRRTWLVSVAACIAVMASGGWTASARDIHVSEAGSDSGPGTEARPYRTINQAASVAQPGDTVLVHGGTYREWVRPPRGGTGENHFRRLEAKSIRVDP